jgi:hypothetical protein
MKKLGLLVAPVLLTLACGGVDDILGGTDGSTVSPCAAGVVPYQVKTGVYTTVSVPLRHRELRPRPDRRQPHDGPRACQRWPGQPDAVLAVNHPEVLARHRHGELQHGHPEGQRHRQLGRL